MFGIGHWDLIIILLLALGIGVGGTIFWVRMLVDCALHESNQGNDKLVWIIVIAITHLPGALVYYFVRRPRRRAEQELPS